MMSKPQKDQNAVRITSPAEEQAIIGHITTSLIGPNLQNVEILNRHAGEIIELREQLEQKDVEIADLRKKVKDLEEKNYDLLIKLDAKDEEVKTLKDRIQNLEDEKKVLQQELAAVQYKLKTIEDDVKKLTKSRESEDAKSAKLEGEFKKILYTLNEVKEDLAATKTDNENLKKQFRHQSRYVAGAPPRLPVQASEDTIAMLHLGEMCWQIQAAMYKTILPQHFTPIISYKIKAFEKDIEKLSKSEEDKQQGFKRWEELKTELKWNEDLEGALDALQDTYSRNYESIPQTELCDSVLKKHAAVLEKQGILKGWLSIERVNGLIDVWKRLYCSI